MQQDVTSRAKKKDRKKKSCLEKSIKEEKDDDNFEFVINKFENKDDFNYFF
jgi:hypothetical protein